MTKKPDVHKEILLSSISIRPGQPRTEFPEADLRELADSITQQGLIQEITVRPRPGGKAGQYELVVGERRYRASLLADQTTIHAIIRELTDEEVEDIQDVENLQRCDLTPLEEARSYERRLRKAIPLAELALKLGKSERYIQSRLNLLTLPEVAQEYLRTKVMPLKVALTIAELTPKNQARAVKYMMESTAAFDGDEDYAKRPRHIYCRSHKELVMFLERDVLRVLNRAAFPTDAPVPGVAEDQVVSMTCVGCPQRTCAKPDLFGAILEQDRCMNRRCWAVKEAGYWDDMQAQAERKYGTSVPFLLDDPYVKRPVPPKAKSAAARFGVGAVRWIDEGASFCEQATPFIRISDKHEPRVVPACVYKNCRCRQSLRPEERPAQLSDVSSRDVYYAPELLPAAKDRMVALRTSAYTRNHAITALAMEKEPFGGCEGWDSLLPWRVLCWKLADDYHDFHKLAQLLERFYITLVDDQGRALTGTEGNRNLWNNRGLKLYQALEGVEASNVKRIAWALLVVASVGNSYGPDPRIDDLTATMLTPEEVADHRQQSAAAALADIEAIMADASVFKPVADAPGRIVWRNDVTRYGIGMPDSLLPEGEYPAFPEPVDGYSEIAPDSTK